MDTLKLTSSQKPLTAEMIQKGLLKPGDYLVPRETLRDIYQNNKGFIKGKIYEVKSIEGDNVFLLSENGLRGIHFKDAEGGAQWFDVIELTPEEEMGVLGSIPRDILILLNNYSQATRNSLAEELAIKYGIRDKDKKDQLKESVVKALSILQKEGYVETGRTIGAFKITTQGRMFLRS